MSSRATKDFLRLVFRRIIQSVKPRELISSQIKVINDTLSINGEEFKLNKNCYMVGFGKAVYEMGCEMKNVLKGHLIETILSVPVGSIQNNVIKDNKFKVFEGAKNNIPDVGSLNATNEILNLVDRLEEKDLLIVLISGGGSALLTHPIPSVTLAEKIATTKLLANAGADIRELNTVRKFLSTVKGGRLAERTFPSTVISLILSDVINDPLDTIASGPTVPNLDSPQSALSIIEKYSICNRIPVNVMCALRDNKGSVQPLHMFEKSHTFIIGNNLKALLAGKKFLEENRCVCCVLSNSMEGSVNDVALSLSELILYSCRSLLCQQVLEYPATLLQKLSISEESFRIYISELKSCRQDIFFLLGGETTVKVEGSGLGGRNMELALRTSFILNASLENNKELNHFDINVLCGGTDGIDGPTDAAGAIAYPGQADLAKVQGLDISQYLEDNDSYNFYRSLSGGEDLVVTGHTGTNVMDIVLVHIKGKHTEQ